MKIPINKDSMSNLQLGDTVTAAIGGTMKVTERKQGFSPRPHDLKFEGFSGIYSYSDRGILCGGDIHPLDIVAIEKALEIPEGFTPWGGGRCPVPDGTKVEIVMRDDYVQAYLPAGDFHWEHQGSRGDIVGYRVISRPKQEGEIWAVVGKSPGGQEYCDQRPSQKRAVEVARKLIKDNWEVLAIFNPALTGGKWKEGDGRELWEGK